MRKEWAPGWDWPAAILLFLLLQVTAGRLVSTDWARDLYWTETLAGFGAVLGLALGISRFRTGLVLLFSCLYSAFVLPWQITRSASDDLLLDRLNRVGWTLYNSLNQFFQQQPVKEPLLFLTFVCALFWILSLAAGYQLARRGRVLGSIMLAGAAIVIVQAYANYQPHGSWWLAVFALLGLLLAGRMHFLRQRAGWSGARVFVGEDSGTNLLISLFMTASAAILVAWWIPGSPGAIQRAAEMWNARVDPLKEKLSNAVTSLQGPHGRSGINFYGSALQLGQKASVGDNVVFTATVVDSPGLNVRYYWRGRAYNVYNDGLWSTSSNARIEVHADHADLGIPDASNRTPGVFLITSEFPSQRLLYAPSPVVWVDRVADVAAIKVETNVFDAFAWESRTVVAAGSSYEVRSVLRNPTVPELRSAGTEYPLWVRDQYLGLPASQRQALQAMAADIVGTAENPYDKANAITNYLRNNIEYAGSVPQAPEGDDPIVWFLRDYKKGFCNYYASAEVLLLRSVGVPARLAAGFARGDLDGDVYTVRRRDAHAWPEVYFPGIGWTEFEPTSSQAPLNRPIGAQAGVAGTPEEATGGPESQVQSRMPEDVEIGGPAAALPFRLTPAGRLLYALMPILGIILVVLLAYRLKVFNRLPALLSRAMTSGGGAAPTWLRDWERWNRLEPIERIFVSVGWTLRLLDAPPPPSATPASQCAALTRLIPAAGSQIQLLLGELESGLFTPRGASLRRARVAAAGVIWVGIRERLRRLLASLNGHAVYSDTRF